MCKESIRCAVYIRVSTAEQQMYGKSLEAQKEYLVRYAAEHGMTVMGIFADEGKTARKELRKRKAIHALLQAVRQGDVDVILFWRIDRWFRSLSDFYKVQDILDTCGVHWISASEPGLNMETRDGRLQLNVVLSIGQNEVDTTSERIRFVNDSSIRQGKLIFGDHNMPFGYKSGMADHKKCMVKDPCTQHMAEAFFQYYRRHQNKSSAVRFMQETYGINFSYSMLRTMLSSEFYKGTYRGMPYCPAYLTEQEWLEIQRISGNGQKRPRSDRTYLFAGLIRCPLCGQRLAGTGCSSTVNRKTGEKRTYCYYRCNKALTDQQCSNRRRVSQNQIENALLRYLEPPSGNIRLQDICITAKPKAKRSTPASCTAGQIEAEISRLNTLYQKGRIAWDHYNREYERLSSEKSRIQKAVTYTSVSQSEPKDYTSIQLLLERGFKAVYMALTPEYRKVFWLTSLKNITLDDSGHIQQIDFT